MVNYKNKYLKYKLKYQKLIGGMETSLPQQPFGNETLAFILAQEQIKDPDLLKLINETMTEQYKNLYDPYLFNFLHSRDNITAMEKKENYDFFINQDNKAQFLIVRDYLLGQEMKPYQEIAEISTQLKDLIRFQKKENEGKVLNQSDLDKFQKLQLKKQDMINVLTKWKDYKQDILENYEQNLSLKDDLINSLNHYPFIN